MSAIATGSIRTAVRLRTAHNPVTRSNCGHARATIIPKRKKTTKVRACPHSSVNSTLRLPASRNPTWTASPATNAAMNMLAPIDSAPSMHNNGNPSRIVNNMPVLNSSVGRLRMPRKSGRSVRLASANRINTRAASAKRRNRTRSQSGKPMAESSNIPATVNAMGAVSATCSKRREHRL